MFFWVFCLQYVTPLFFFLNDTNCYEQFIRQILALIKEYKMYLPTMTATEYLHL